MISNEDVLKIAKLAHLNIGEDEIAEYAHKLGSILDYVKQLQGVDVSGITPMSHVHGSSNIYREDVATPSMEVDKLKQNAPDMNGRFIKVPIIIE